jgi:DNA-binding MarR family transcriptional regulator
MAQQHFIAMNRLFRRLLQKNRFIRKLTHTGLSRSEVHILIEVQAQPGLKVSDLLAMAGIEQSTLSRLLRGMHARDLITVSTSKSDRRTKTITLCDEGLKAIRAIDQVAGPLFDQFAERIGSREQGELARFFERIGDYFGQPKACVRSGESHLRAEQRRVTRAFGILSNRAFGSELSSTHWHILSEICSRNHPPTPTEVSQLLGIPPNSLSEICKKLEARSLVRRVSDKNDLRRTFLHATTRGKEFFQSLERSAALDLEQAFSDLGAQKTEHYLDILSRYVGEGDDPINVLNTLPGDLLVSELHEESEYQRIRSFAIKESIALGNLDSLPHTIIHPTSRIFILLQKDESEKTPRAVIEYGQHKNNYVLTLAAWASDITQNTLYSFWLRTQDTIRLLHKKAHIAVEYGPVKSLFVIK